MFEADLSLLNGYRQPLSSHPSLLPSSLGFRAHDEDSDVFSSCTHNEGSVTALDNGQTRSSLGSCGSGEGQLLHPLTSLSADRRTVVEWKATSENRHHHDHQLLVKSEIHSPSSGASPGKLHQIDFHVGEVEHSGMNGIHEHRGVAIVEIPQPEDQLSSNIHTGFDSNIHSTQNVGPQELPEEEEEDLFADLSESDTEDSETDEPDISSQKRICFLSRQYFHLWKSPGMSNSPLLLPPSDGIMWQNNHKRPPLVDLSHQSGYYRMWSKPLLKGVRLAIDSATKEYATGSERRFLLSGPARVSKEWVVFRSILIFAFLYL